MFEVTPAASEKIASYFKGKEVRSIRIYFDPDGCGGPSLAMTLDDSNEKDQKFTVDGFNYIIERDFFDQAQPIKLDFKKNSFRFESSLNLKGRYCPGCHSGGYCTH